MPQSKLSHYQKLTVVNFGGAWSRLVRYTPPKAWRAYQSSSKYFAAIRRGELDATGCEPYHFLRKRLAGDSPQRITPFLKES